MGPVALGLRQRAGRNGRTCSATVECSNATTTGQEQVSQYLEPQK